MSNTQPKSHELIDALIRDLLRLAPESIARLAHGDAQVSPQHLAGEPVAADPLDGLDLVARRAMATCLSLRTHRGAVSLATERQARDAGWSCAKLANLSLVLGWSLHLATDSAAAMPILLVADETTRAHPLIRLADLPAFGRLIRALRCHRPYRSDRANRAARDHASPRRLRTLASPSALLQELLGVDARTVELSSSEQCGPDPISGDARAVRYWVWLAVEMLEIAQTLLKENVPAARIKTEADARLAGHPRATACNFALLLGAALVHGTGYTVHMLPPDEKPASALMAAGRRNASGSPRDLEEQVVALLDLEDIARRAYIHVGREAAAAVAIRLYDAGEASRSAGEGGAIGATG